MAEVKECSSCSMCHKQSGLPILLTRYAVAAKKPTSTAALYGTHEDDTLPLLLGNNDAPPLTGDFKASIDNKGTRVELGDGAQYSLRLLRPGYVYVFNPKDPDEQKWRGYVVTNEQYLQEFQVTSKLLKFEREGLKDRLVPCKPNKNEMLSRCITIPGADLAEDIWIGFSDTRWTDKQLRQNEQDAALRDRHMRKIDLAKYLKAKKHDHAVCIHSLPKEDDGWVRPIIAEYAYTTPEKIDLFASNASAYLVSEDLRKEMADYYKKYPFKEAPCDFDFSAAPFQRLGSMVSTKIAPIESPEHKQALLAAEKKPQPSLSELQPAAPKPKSAPAKPKPVAASGTFWERLKAKGAEVAQQGAQIAQQVAEALPEAGRLHIKSALDTFTHLVKEFDRFYAIQDEQKENSEHFKGAGMILALDDAPAITADLAGLIEARWYAFKTQKLFYRPLMTSECIALARSTVPAKAEEARANRRIKAMNTIAENQVVVYGQVVAEVDDPSSDEAYKELEKQNKDPDSIIAAEHEAILRKYDSLLQPEKINDFFKASGDYALKATAFGEQVIDPLAKAHAAWFKSPCLVDTFICNFDSSEGVVENGKVDARDPGYREHGGPYIDRLTTCIGGTGDHPICEPFYRQMLTCEVSELNERNLLWMAVNFNRDVLADKIKENLIQIEQIKEDGQAFNSAHRALLDDLFADNAPGISFRDARVKRGANAAAKPPETEATKDKVVDFIRKWGWAWWDAICTSRLTELDTLYGEKKGEVLKLNEDLKRFLEEREKARNAHHKVRAWRIAEEEAARARETASTARGDATTARSDATTARSEATTARSEATTARGTATNAGTAAGEASGPHSTAQSALAGANKQVDSTQSRIAEMKGDLKTAQYQHAAQQTSISDSETAINKAKLAKKDALAAVTDLKNSLRRLPGVAAETQSTLEQVEKSLSEAEKASSVTADKINTRKSEIELARTEEARLQRAADAIYNKLEARVPKLAEAMKDMPRQHVKTQYGRLLARIQQSVLKEVAKLEASGKFTPSLSIHHFLAALAAVEGAPVIVLQIKSTTFSGAQKALARVFGNDVAQKALAPMSKEMPKNQKSQPIEIHVQVQSDMDLVIQSVSEDFKAASAGNVLTHQKAATGELIVKQENLDELTKSGALRLVWKHFLKYYPKLVYWEAERQRLEGLLSTEQRVAIQQADEAQALRDQAEAERANQEKLKADAEEQLRQRQKAHETAVERSKELKEAKTKLDAQTAEGTATQGKIDKLNASIAEAEKTLIDEKAAVTTAENNLRTAETKLNNANAEASRTAAEATRLENKATGLEGDATRLEGKATELEGKATRLEGQATNLEGKATGLEGDAKTARAETNTASSSSAVAQEREAFRQWKEARGKVMDLRKTLKQSEAVFQEMRGKLIGGGVLAVFNVGMAVVVLWSWGNELDKYKDMANDKDKLRQIAANDKDYIKAKTMYYASVVNFAAGMSDLLLVSARAGAMAKQWGWAIRMTQIMENKYYVILGRTASSALSFVGAIWDLVEAKEYGEKGEIKLRNAYYVSAALGFATCIAIMAAASFWIMLPLMLAYAVCMVVISKMTPDRLEAWLKTCYFGIEPKNDSLNLDDWKGEIQEFQKATNLRPALQAGQ